MLASIVASRVTNNASVTNLAFVMLTEFVWRSELAIPAFTIVLANASTATFFTPAAYAHVRLWIARCTPDMFSAFCRVDPP